MTPTEAIQYQSKTIVNRGREIVHLRTKYEKLRAFSVRAIDALNTKLAEVLKENEQLKRIVSG